MPLQDGLVRCEWVSDDEDYIHYHDKEWGVPVTNEQLLFEMLILEGCQAGLSWITVLKKREHYRKVLDGFDPVKMATYDDTKIADLLGDPGIIRNKLKVNSHVSNAKALLKMRENGEDFVTFIWSFVDGKPVNNAYATLQDIPAKTAAAEAMSKALLKKGFKFVGPTICYAFMQAVGMVNDHVVDCHRYAEIVRLHDDFSL